MAKIKIDEVYKERLIQIEQDLKKEYYKGKRKSKSKIAKLLQEKERLKRLV